MTNDELQDWVWININKYPRLSMYNESAAMSLVDLWIWVCVLTSATVVICESSGIFFVGMEVL